MPTISKEDKEWWEHFLNSLILRILKNSQEFQFLLPTHMLKTKEII